MKKNGTFLHVGCGSKTKQHTPFSSSDWKEIRLDINQKTNPDIIGTMLNMENVKDKSVDAVLSSHNLEHVYPHEVEIALKEFKRVLKDTGFLLVTCPDLESVCSLVADNKLTETAYTSSIGPITPLDILYGHRVSIAMGNHYMAHKCGFTSKTLNKDILLAGFSQVATAKGNNFDLWALGTCSMWEKDKLVDVCNTLFKKP